MFIKHFGSEVATGLLSRIVPIEKIRNISAGTKVKMRTEFARGELLDIVVLALHYPSERGSKPWAFRLKREDLPKLVDQLLMTIGEGDS